MNDLVAAAKELLDALDYVEAAVDDEENEAANRLLIAIDKLRALVDGESWRVGP